MYLTNILKDNNTYELWLLKSVKKVSSCRVQPHGHYYNLSLFRSSGFCPIFCFPSCESVLVSVHVCMYRICISCSVISSTHRDAYISSYIAIRYILRIKKRWDRCCLISPGTPNTTLSIDWRELMHTSLSHSSSNNSRKDEITRNVEDGLFGGDIYEFEFTARQMEQARYYKLDCNCIRSSCRLSNASRIFSRRCNRTPKSSILRKSISHRSRDRFTSHEPAEFNRNSWSFSLQPIGSVVRLIYIFWFRMQVCEIDTGE